MNKSSWFHSVGLALPLVLGAFVAAAQLQSTDVPVADPSIPAGLPGSALTEPRVLSSSLPEVVERGPHHAVTQVTKQIQWADGRVEWATNRYTELANGMNVLDANGQYQPAEAVFELFNNGVIARKTAHQVILAPSPVADVPVDLLMPDGLRLTSRVIGINLYDSASGQSTLIGEARDCAGKLVALDTVVFAGAFDGVDADLVYHLSRGGLSQEVILRENLSEHAPEVYQFDPASTRVEVVTEFFDPPKPEVTETVLVAEADPQKRAAKHEPDFSDQMLTWPTMLIGPGKAFAENEPADAPTLLPPPLMVGKRLETIAGRTLLFEAVSFGDLQPLLDNLPDGQQANANPKREVKICQTRQEMLARLHAAKATTKAIQVAQALPRRKGLVWDYNALISMTNFTFLANTTYFLDTGPDATLSGTTTIEGGTVIKFGKYAVNETVRIVLLGPLACNTTTYRPAIFTAKDDNTVGAAIDGSTGSPSGYYAYRALLCYVNAANNFIHDVRFNYALNAVSLYGFSGHTVRHAQFGNCGATIEAYNAGSAALQNLLFYNSLIVCDSYYTPISGEHLTVNASGSTSTPLFYNATNSTFALTNSLFVNVTNIGTITSISNATNSSATGVLQTVGAGAHYLVASSAYRNAGTANINAALAKELKTRTTYPPIILTNDFTVNTTLAPQAQRDTDIPDLGWHYAPLDYIWSTLNLDAATLILTNGVAIANYGSRGTILKANANFYSEGSPVNMNRMVRPYAVQEQPILLGGAAGNFFFEGYYWWQPSELRCRFTEFSLNSEEDSKHHLIKNYGNIPITLSITDCQFRNFWNDWGVLTNDTALHTVSLTNNLWEYTLLSNRQDANWKPYTLNCYNNTFHGGTVQFSYNTNSTTWTARDNLFEVSLLTQGSYTFTNSNNGYTTGVTVLTGGTTNKTGLVAAYQTGSLGGYYFPTNGSSTSLTNLLNTGSRAASAAGLYHYTTTTNNMKEASSTVDIGFHYVAVNTSGQAIDTDGDGFSDYYEDRDGDGTVDSGETNWNSATDFGLKVWITQPKNNSNLP